MKPFILYGAIAAASGAAPAIINDPYCFLPLTDDANDVSGNARHFTETGAGVTYDTTKAAFDGVDYLTGPAGFLETATDITWTLWVQTPSSDLQRLLFRGEANVSIPQPILQYMPLITAGDIVFYTHDGSGNNLISRETDLSSLTFIACRWNNSTKLLEASVNGGAWTTHTADDVCGTSTETQNIGGGAGFNWLGSITHCGVWQRVLTDAEVALLYNGGTPLNPME
jgi:hypothetical protein